MSLLLSTEYSKMSLSPSTEDSKMSPMLSLLKRVECYCCYLLKGVLHPCALFLKTLCNFSKNKATSGKIFYGSGQKCSKELKKHSFTSVETIVVKLQ